MCKTRVSAVLTEMLFFTWNDAQGVRRAKSELKRSGSSDTPTLKFKINKWGAL